MKEWTSVKDELPVKGKDVLACDGMNIAVAHRDKDHWNKDRYPYDYWCISGVSGMDTMQDLDEGGVTHWMKLPNLPKK